jgi:hypothetical protein
MEKQFQYLQQMMSKDGKLPQISTGGNVQPQMTKEKTAGGSQPASTTKTPSHTKSSVQKPKEEPKDATADSRSKTSTTSQGPEKSKEQESQGLLQKQKSEITKPSYKPESHEQILPPKQRGIGKDQADTTVSPHGKDVQQQQHQKIQQPGSSKEVRDAALDKPGPQTKTDSSQRTHSQQTTQPRETKPRESKADPLDKQDSHDKIKTQERHAEKKVEERGNEPSPRGYLTVDTGNKPTPPRQLSRGTPDKCQQTSTKPDDPFKSSKDQSQQAPEMGKIPGSKHGADFVSARDPKQPIFPDTSRSKLGLDSGISHKSPFVRAGLATLTDTPGYGVPSTVKKDVAPTSTPKSTLGGPGGKTAKGDALDELLGKSKSGSDKCSPVVAGQYPTHPSPSGMTIGQKTARSLLNPH